MTRMFSEIPGRPGRRQQMPRMSRSILTPAREAEQSAVIAVGSTSAFIRSDDPDGLRDPRETRAEAADAADEQVDLDAGARGRAERGDRRGIDERVHQIG